MADKHDINQLIKDYTHPEEVVLSELKPKRRLAGIWQGIDNYKDMTMLVKRDVTLKICIPVCPVILQDITLADQPWSEAHFQERVGGQPLNPGESYKIWPYANFNKNTEFRKDEKFDHSYMERFWPKFAGYAQFDGLGLKNCNELRESDNLGIRFKYGDYNDVIQQLTRNTLTRQAYLPIFFPEDTGAKNNIRVPCTLGYLFEIWDGKLDMTYYIRSCDVFRHFRNDIYLAGRLIQHTTNILLLNGIDIKPGELNMKINNLHAFENDIYALKQKEKRLCKELKENNIS
jgi:hypothetical protein